IRDDLVTGVQTCALPISLNQGPGYAAIASAFGGTWYVNGHADRPPARPTPVYPDYMTGLFTAFGVLAALRHRDATGEGQWIDARSEVRRVGDAGSQEGVG